METVAVAIIAGLVQGITGFGFGLVAASLWAWMMEPRAVVPMLVLGSLVSQFSSIHNVRQHMNLRRSGPFLLGGVIATPIGVAVLGSIDVTAFRGAVGLALVLYCSWMLLEQNFPRTSKGGRLLDGVAGGVAGLMGGVSGLQGPPMIIWCALRGWAVAEQRATYQIFFIVTQSLMFVLLWSSGIADDSHLQMLWVLAPAVIVSSIVGTQLSRLFGDRAFQRMLYGFLWLSGISLLIPALSEAVSLSWSDISQGMVAMMRQS